MVEHITLLREGGRLVYLIAMQKGAKQKPALVDALTGMKLSPIDDRFASQIATEYVKAPATVASVKTLATYVTMTGRELKDVLEVTFNESSHPRIILDRSSGANVDEVDGARKFQYWVRKLHQFQFFGTKKELTAIPGLALLFLTITGVMILWRRYKPKKRPS